MIDTNHYSMKYLLLHSGETVNDEQGYFEVDIQHNVHLKIISEDADYVNIELLATA